MNIVCHPGYMHGDVASWVCDNYRISADGPAQRVHKYPQEIVEIG